MPKRLTINEMQKIAEGRGGKCLSDEYANNYTKLKWQCKKGHTWWAMPNLIKNIGTWCPKCAGRKKPNIKEMQEIAEERGGKCLSTEFLNVHTKLEWQCKKGHTWWAMPSGIKSGRWCPGCKKLTIEELQEIAEEREGKCLSTEYVGAQSKLEWQCKKGHTWWATPQNVKNKKSWCPVCARFSKKHIHKPHIKRSIEDMQKIAEERGGKCLSTEFLTVRTKVEWQCKKGHTWWATPNNVEYNDTWCPYCSGKTKLTIEDAKRSAEKRGGKCLSYEYTDNHTKLKWQCEKGHTWDAEYRNIRKGQWCRECKKLTIEDMQKLAEKREGKCLSTEYVGAQTKLEWQCKRGHIWWAQPNSIKYLKTWCPICAGRKK